MSKASLKSLPRWILTEPISNVMLLAEHVLETSRLANSEVSGSTTESVPMLFDFLSQYLRADRLTSFDLHHWEWLMPLSRKVAILSAQSFLLSL
ncbi:MAG TPA: hypothetical protein VD999_00045 [Vitreimonas sp.]|nr:hypothetical protein [Vitreimonas sp.]